MTALKAIGAALLLAAGLAAGYWNLYHEAMMEHEIAVSLIQVESCQNQ